MLKKIVYILLFSIALNAKFIGDAGYGYNFYRYEEPELMKIEGALHTIFAKLAYSTGIDVSPIISLFILYFIQNYVLVWIFNLLLRIIG